MRANCTVKRGNLRYKQGLDRRWRVYTLTGGLLTEGRGFKELQRAIADREGPADES